MNACTASHSLTALSARVIEDRLDASQSLVALATMALRTGCTSVSDSR